MHVRLACVIFSFLLLGCDAKPNPAEKETTIEKALSTQLDSLEKAKSVEQQLKKDAELRKQQIDERGG